MPKFKKPKPKLNAEQKRRLSIQRTHIRNIRSIFKTSGFTHISELANREFQFADVMCDFDDLFVLKNVLVLVEYTTNNEENISGHLLKKKILFDKINGDQSGFISYLKLNFAAAQKCFDRKFDNVDFKVVILYCSRYDIKLKTKSYVPGVIFLDYAYVKYFQNVVNTVKLSSKFEILQFLKVSPPEFDEMAINPQLAPTGVYEGSVLPEANSHFDPGYKIVSFYVDAQALLQRAYVLRRDGWRTETNIYQRMINKRKIEAIRSHLLEQKGVFINNIIVTLPSTTKLVDKNDIPINVENIRKTTSGRLRLPNEFNSIGIIDGQHRVFSYHEGGTNEDRIAELRIKQNLLVTGVIFPNNISDIARTRFEARLFLEINSNQSNAKADLKQEIGLILKPLAAESIARSVLNRMNDGNGPLNGNFAKYFWDTEKLKTTTIVSYGLIPLVRTVKEGTLFERWNNPNKSELLIAKNDSVADSNIELVEEYTKFCAQQIDIFINAFKNNIDIKRWTFDKKVRNRLLTITIINGMIACFRQITNENKIKDFYYYRDRLKNVEDFDFSSYASNGYNKLGLKLFQDYFV
jgi:DGQHR domain-containing protein